MKHSAKRAPGPLGTPFGGQLWSLWRDVFSLFEKGHEKFGKVIRYRVFLSTYHLLVDPKDIRYVLIENKENYSRELTQSTQLLQSITGESILTLDGQEWLKRRKLANPAFMAKSLEKSFSIMQSSINEKIEGWSELCNKSQAIQAASEMSSITANLAGKVFFGSETIWDAKRLEHSIDAILKHHWRRIKSVTDFPHRFETKSKVSFDRGLEYIRSIIDHILKNLQSENYCLLSRLINAEEEGVKLSEQEIKNDAITFLMAGHETTATALQWCLYTLAKEKKWQEKCAEECENVMVGTGLNLKTLENLKLTQQCIQETMRLYPPVWLLERQVIHDDEIAGFYIPANSSILMSPFITQRSKEFWDNPNTFDPERFSTEAKSHNNPAYFPFGVGGHTCIGRSFAMIECTMILASILKNFRIELADSNFVPEYQVGITLRMKKALWIKLEKR